MSAVVKVQLGERSYSIRIGAGLLERPDAWEWPGAGGRGVLVTDTHVAPLHARSLAALLNDHGWSMDVYEVPAGEKSKSPEQLVSLLEFAVERGLDRRSLFWAVGGGVVGDLTGFAAGVFMRGVPFIQVPTTLLAMVDSSVGGKTGINLPSGKNLVGVFHQPRLVLADTRTLATLPRREFVSGLAEVIKYGAIADAALLAEVEARLSGPGNDSTAWEPVIARCCEIKAQIVGADEREAGIRAILNFGHTLGHALEKITGYGTYLHGEAVALGMVYAGRLSVRVAGLPTSDCARLEHCIAAAGLPVAPPAVSWDEVRHAMSSDKKSVGAVPRFVLCGRLGQAQAGKEISESILQNEWEKWSNHVIG